ncbi:unnamed protein product (macronuclear) [Paramecium tetraurelia]|uniref:Palmitoyltransferase n=1 Tax=Paramecium tetraurelia TaxID=5888 RepID=A0BD33_PARTE|nr:uncharacterized protein GSPATT00004544001 [Paramecium tetraurelia]CAK56450.1 unnamed protein product [Paramecium tetraurelia]|eukprot:XP_001423848.1 hypothetical protein (macronuclear) [Paramecium tetraurelia strain d4-2]
MKVRSGCSQYPSLLQIFIIVFYVLNTVMTYIHIMILEEHTAHYIIFSILLSISGYFCIKTTICDPTDSYVIQQQKSRGTPFDYEEHQLNQFCELCIAYVKETTKHCKQCNRCCEDFDHHCRWINNCVGGKNYKQFIGMIVFTFIILIYSIIVNGRVISQYNKQELETLTIYSKYKRSLLIITIVLLVLETIASLLLLQLIVFHIYLWKKGISTYEYIIQRRSKQVQPSNFSEFNIINNQESKMDIIKNNREQEEQSVVFRKDKEKQASQIYTNSELMKKDESLCSSKKNSQSILQKRKLTQGDSDDSQKEGVINFFSQRIQSNVDLRLQSRQMNTIDVKTPEITQFQ